MVDAAGRTQEAHSGVVLQLPPQRQRLLGVLDVEAVGIRKAEDPGASVGAPADVALLEALEEHDLAPLASQPPRRC